MKEMGSCCEQK